MTGRTPGRVRIVAGAKRSRRLEVPTSADVRPTSEMVRGAVFDVLGPVGRLRVLDLFAGTGALGLEALSRGASECVFVELDGRIASVLRRNIEALEYEALCRVVVGDYRRAAESLVARSQLFDLLFVDPPYRMLAEVEATLTPLVPSLLSPEGVVVVEGPRPVKAVFGLSPIFEREYGDTKITVVRQKE